MIRKTSSILILFLSLGFLGYSQEDSMRSKNDKPGTPQSLRTPDQSPQSTITIINSNSAPGQTTNHAAAGSNNKTVLTDPNTSDKPIPTTTITNTNTPPRLIDSTTNRSAIRNGMNNVTNPIRNK